MDWDKNISSFIQSASDHAVRMIMVGGGAANFYGYQIPVVRVDFWIEATSENLNKIMLVLKEIGSKLGDFHIPIIDRKHNILIEFSSSSLNLELFTNFLVDKSFSWAYDDSIEASLQQDSNVKWRVLALEDLIDSKTRSLDPRDLVDLQALKRISEERI